MPPGILGHKPTIERLWSSLARGTLHHALLFEGPVGVGKRTVAVRLAMAANCERTSGPDAPCGECPACRLIEQGTHPDVVTLSPTEEQSTATIPVDRIREVVRQTGYHRYAARRRMILIDPTEALRPEAANALLKTLEEPPENTGFILIATHASALLPTVVSRCQRFRFGPVPAEELVPWLSRRGVETPERLARRSLGCPGRALELADGGLGERDALRDQLLDVLGGPIQGVFDFSERLCAAGSRQDWSARLQTLLEVQEELLRDVAHVATGTPHTLLHDDIPEVTHAWAGRLWPGGLVNATRAIKDARDDLAANVTGRLIAEALLTAFRRELRS
jgi:DNA polymerase-3 subunit delta'